LKVAIVHDWLVECGGAEKVLAEILNLYPEADIFTMVCYLDETQLPCLKNRNITTSFIQRLPFAKNKYRSYFPLMPLAVEQFDLSGYKLVISSSYCVAKGVLTGPDQLHISYCHSPMRYAWDLQNQYLKESNLDRGFKSWVTRYILHKMRIWDVRSSYGVDYFIANSNFIARRIKKVYRRYAEIIHPNVAVNDFTCTTNKEDFYLTCSRLVPYKKIDLIVEAFKRMPEKKLIVIGDGPEMNKIKALTASNISLLGYQNFESLRSHMARAKAFVFAAEEDFGIVPVEVQACGTPVIAYGKGGALETVLADVTGVFFEKQSTDSIIKAITKFETMDFDAKTICNHAQQFSTEMFNTKLKTFIDRKLYEFEL
jgi:glycosyltransferase involved in cell wall biosynthesis